MQVRSPLREERAPGPASFKVSKLRKWPRTTRLVRRNHFIIDTADNRVMSRKNAREITLGETPASARWSPHRIPPHSHIRGKLDGPFADCPPLVAFLFLICICGTTWDLHCKPARNCVLGRPDQDRESEAPETVSASAPNSGGQRASFQRWVLRAEHA